MIQAEALHSQEDTQFLKDFNFKKTLLSESLGTDWIESLGDCEFQPQATINRFIRLLNEENDEKGFTREVLLQQFIHEVTQDFRGFSQEFVDKTGLTPTNYSGITDKKGEFHLYGSSYGGESLFGQPALYAVVNMISDDERLGEVKKSWQKVERYAAKLPSGSLIMMTSPSGPSGLFNEEGEQFIYADSRTYFFEVYEEKLQDGGFIRHLYSVDVQSDFTLDEHRRLVGLENNEEPNDIVASVIAFAPQNDEKVSVRDGIERMKLVRKDQDNGDFIYQNRTFDEVLVEAKDQSLLESDEKYRPLLIDFTRAVMHFGSHEHFNLTSIKEALTMLILEAFMQKKAKENQVFQGGFDDGCVKTNYDRDQSFVPLNNGGMLDLYQKESLNDALLQARQASANCPPPDYFANMGLVGSASSSGIVNGRSGFWFTENTMEALDKDSFACPGGCGKMLGKSERASGMCGKCGYTKEQAQVENGKCL